MTEVLSTVEILEKYNIKTEIINQSPFKGDDGKYHYIYLTICLVNNKFYVGKHTSESYINSYFGSGLALKNAINKYGKSNFKKYILEYNLNGYNNEIREMAFITKNMVLSANCYNIIPGELNSGLLGDFHPSRVSSKNGTHHWIGENNPGRIASRNGTHAFFGESNPIHKKNKLGLNPTTLRSKNGTHNFMGIKPWDHHSASPSSKNAWANADLLYKLYLQDNSIGYRKIMKQFETFSHRPIVNILKYFKQNNWVPELDPEWVKFKTSFKFTELTIGQ